MHGQLLIDPRTGATLDIGIDLEASSLHLVGPGGPAVERFDTSDAMEIRYREVVRERYRAGWIDNDTSSERVLDFPTLVERDEMLARIKVPPDPLASYECEMTADVIQAIAAAVRHADARDITEIRVGRGEFDYANVAIDGAAVLASDISEPNALFFDWGDALLSLYDTVTGEPEVQLYHADTMGARVAARIERDRLLPTDVAARMTNDFRVHVCSFDDARAQPSERETAHQGIDRPLSAYLASRWS